VRIAVGEACMNAVRHAYADGEPGPVRLHGTTDWHEVTLTVEDRGPGPIPRPLERTSLGLGLPIIASVCDHWSVGDAEGCGTRVRMVFSR
jgi:anti-sigma regulatory factor (Ser/Thr protein kinase)